MGLLAGLFEKLPNGHIDEAALTEISDKYKLSAEFRQRVKNELVLLNGMHRGDRSKLPKDAASSSVKHMQKLDVLLKKLNILLEAKEHTSAIYSASRAVFGDNHAPEAGGKVTEMFKQLQSDAAEMRTKGYFALQAADLPQDHTPWTTYRSDLIGFRLPALYAEVTGKKLGGSKLGDQAQNATGFAFVNLCLRAMGLVEVSPETIKSHKDAKRKAQPKLG